jgi:type IV pilus assembly protein PilV
MSRRSSSRGFSLIEVMVALIVLSVGLLGIARMQSLALSSTSVASQRSMAAIEAEGLAAAMHANRGYWTNTDPAGGTIKVAGTTVTVASGASALSAALGTACLNNATPCTPAQLAAYDLALWSADLKSVLPGDSALIACGTVTPVNCTITLTWAESIVGVNAQQATTQQGLAGISTLQNSTYTLYVQP